MKLHKEDKKHTILKNATWRIRRGVCWRVCLYQMVSACLSSVSRGPWVCLCVGLSVTWWLCFCVSVCLPGCHVVTGHLCACVCLLSVWFCGSVCQCVIAQLVKNPPAMQKTQFNSWVGKICWRRNRLPTPVFLGFPCGSAGKESACNTGDLGSIPGLGRSPGEGKGYPLQYSGPVSMGSQRVGHNWVTFTFKGEKRHPILLHSILYSFPRCS